LAPHAPGPRAPLSRRSGAAARRRRRAGQARGVLGRPTRLAGPLAGAHAGEGVTVPGARSIVVRRAFAARPARVFAAWCRRELMAQWFLPAPGWRADVAADVRVGGRYKVAMYDPAGGVHVQEGAYRAIEPDARLVFTWTCEDLGVADSLVTVELREVGAQT